MQKPQLLTKRRPAGRENRERKAKQRLRQKENAVREKRNGGKRSASWSGVATIQEEVESPWGNGLIKGGARRMWQKAGEEANSSVGRMEKKASRVELALDRRRTRRR